MATDTAYAIADAYRWQRRAGQHQHRCLALSYCHRSRAPERMECEPCRRCHGANRCRDRLCLQSDGSRSRPYIVAGDPHGLLYAQRVSRPPRARRLRGTPRHDPDWRRVAWPERDRGRPVRNPRRKARSAAASTAASRALHAGGHRRAQGDAGSHSGLPGGRPRSVGRARHKLRFRTLARRFLRLMAYHCLGLGLRDARSFCEAPDPR